MSASRSSLKSQARGVRTRQRIKNAVVRLLEEEDYFDLSINRICEAAKVATGGFYFHYKNKEEIITDIFDEHYRTFWTDLSAAADYGDLYSAIYHANQVFVRAISTRPGLSRCFNQHATIDREIVTRWETSATEWAMAFATAVTNSPGVLAKTKSEAFLQIYVLIGYTDALLCQVFVEQDPHLADVTTAPDRLAEDLSILWFRSLTGQDPRPDRLAFQKGD